MQFLKEKFILLKKIKYGESDLILHALSTEGAKIGFIAKGALKSKKRFAGGILEPTHFVRFSYKKKTYDSNEGRLFFLDEAELLNGFTGIRTDYDRLQMGLYLVSVVDKVSLEGIIDSNEVFNLLGNALKQLESSKDILGLKTHFEIKLLYQQGVLPQDLLLSSFLKEPLSRHEYVMQDLKRNSEVDESILRSKIHSTMSQYIKEASV